MKFLIKKSIYWSISIVMLLVACLGITTAVPQSNAVASAPVTPTLTATITAPANGAVIQSYTYMVTATVKYITDCESACNVKLTLTVTGPAQVQGSAIANVTPSTLTNNQTGSASWLISATGSGNVTLTVTPSGGFCAVWAPSVFAAGQVVPGSDNQFWPNGAPPILIVPASVTVNQQIGYDTGSVAPSVGGGGSYGYSTSSQVTVTSLNVQPQQAIAGQPISILANVSNKGDAQRSYNATLKINNEVVEVKSGTLGANAARPLEFTITRDKPGTYLADVNGQQMSFTITGSSQPTPLDPRMIIIAILSVLALAVVVVLVRHVTAR